MVCPSEGPLQVENGQLVGVDRELHDWATDPRAAGEWVIDENRGHKTLAIHFWEAVRQGPSILGFARKSVF